CYSFFVSPSAHTPIFHSFPTRRSSDLVLGRVVHAPSRRSRLDQLEKVGGTGQAAGMSGENAMRAALHRPRPGTRVYAEAAGSLRDRKSTRLNSSHVAISYAVFCLKKKT